MKAIIVDDEAQSIKTLESKLEMLASDIEVVATFQDPQNALKSIKNYEIDVLFLDIEMPTFNGFQLLEQLRPYHFPVVFVTAYNQYAVRAFRMSALDYLLKPIDVEDLNVTLDRLRHQKIQTAPPQYDERFSLLFDSLKNFSTQNNNSCADRIALSTQEGVLFVGVRDILRVEASGNYSIFYMTEKNKIIVSRTLKEFEDVLIPYHFIRVSRADLVSVNAITKYQKGNGGIIFMSDGSEIDVSPQRKAALMTKLGLV